MVTIVNQDTVTTMRQMSDNSVSLLFADWPFLGYEKNVSFINTLVRPALPEAHRILESGANIVSVHYPDINMYIAAELIKTGFVICDVIAIQKTNKMKCKNRLGSSYMTLLVACKGDIAYRYIDKSTKDIYKYMYFNKNKFGIIENLWTERMFQSGFRQKDLGKVSEAFPKWIIEKILDIFNPENKPVYDMFGGSGNVVLACVNRNIKVTSSELLSNRFELIRRRLNGWKETRSSKKA